MIFMLFKVFGFSSYCRKPSLKKNYKYSCKQAIFKFQKTLELYFLLLFIYYFVYKCLRVTAYFKGRFGETFWSNRTLQIKSFFFKFSEINQHNRQQLKAKKSLIPLGRFCTISLHRRALLQAQQGNQEWEITCYITAVWHAFPMPTSQWTLLFRSKRRRPYLLMLVQTHSAPCCQASTLTLPLVFECLQLKCTGIEH